MVYIDHATYIVIIIIYFICPEVPVSMARIVSLPEPYHFDLPGEGVW